MVSNVGCCCCCCRDDLSPDEIESGWRISFKGSDKVKMVQWPEATNILGKIVYSEHVSVANGFWMGQV